MKKTIIILATLTIGALMLLESACDLIEMHNRYSRAVSVEVCQMPDLPRASAVCEY
jgi:hypothetical protein